MNQWLLLLGYGCVHVHCGAILTVVPRFALTARQPTPPSIGRHQRDSRRSLSSPPGLPLQRHSQARSGTNKERQRVRRGERRDLDPDQRHDPELGAQVHLRTLDEARAEQDRRDRRAPSPRFDGADRIAADLVTSHSHPGQSHEALSSASLTLTVRRVIEWSRVSDLGS